ncbi:MAG: signal peptidase II, partial [Bacteroidales bacterium]|nr:signal peptidase II [Bacteroidales bacterium]
FYGLIFNESYYHVATLFPPEGGYAGFLFGKVVDMFYFPLFEFDWPQWMPIIGGGHFEFFNAIFNVADSAITVGVIMLVVYQLFFASEKDNIVNLEGGNGKKEPSKKEGE